MPCFFLWFSENRLDEAKFELINVSLYLASNHAAFLVAIDCDELALTCFVSLVTLQNTVLPEAVSYWEQALMVRKTESVIRLSR